MSSALCNVDTQRLELRSAEATPPAPGEVQIDVVSSGIGGTDPHIFHGARDHRVRIPQIPGHEMSGVVAAAGAGVAHVKAGDHVVVYPQPVPLNRCDFFWQELQLIGARVYERQDYHRAIELLACGALPLEKRIIDIVPLEGGRGPSRPCGAIPPP